MKGHKEMKRRAKGGGVDQKYTPEVNVEKEADERKRGGKVEHKVEGKKAKMNLGKPGRKSGGRVGSDKSPLSSAHTVSPVVDHRTDD